MPLEAAVWTHRMRSHGAAPPAPDMSLTRLVGTEEPGRFLDSASGADFLLRGLRRNPSKRHFRRTRDGKRRSPQSRPRRPGHRRTFAQELNQAEERATCGNAYNDHYLVFASQRWNPPRHGRSSMLLTAGADMAVVS